MSATGLEVVGCTLRATRVRLDDTMDEPGPDRRRASHVSRALSPASRDRLPSAEAARLGGRLPILARGVHHEGRRPQASPTAPRRACG